MNLRLTLILVVAALVGGAVFFWFQPRPAPPTGENPAQQAAPDRSPTSSTSDRFLILAASWEPAFCEGARNKPECTGMRPDRHDASNFSLHGLWPRDEYCGVPKSHEQLDHDGRWTQLPPVDLSPALRRELDEVMPGTRSQLERHEWTKHGTCYGAGAEDYYARSVALLRTLNASRVRDLFADNIGKHLTQAEIRTAFDDSFGPNAGERVRVSCDTDGERRIISEITIGLWGNADDTLAQLIRGARPTDGGCDGGIVDPSGLQ